MRPKRYLLRYYGILIYNCRCTLGIIVLAKCLIVNGTETHFFLDLLHFLLYIGCSGTSICLLVPLFCSIILIPDSLICLRFRAVSRHRTLMNVFDKAPVVDKDAFVAPSASIIGDVQVGSGSSIWYGCVLRGKTYVRDSFTVTAFF